ncbi:Disulfide bond formation protein DsbB [Lutimaribacter pacificus]|uniref:Disulfide bond formation protein DsbB n=1 Tax=Lutimaribacter pacificus TaxID=391948 RepID=A0A1H0JRX1_9RHOB|nr:disulfide bond formation protein B [Lutimaribacter pacificus]SDO46279.1 Disulfide bond formation protein DsbB [Lutimaribacter pacificus]SHK07189.1 Disulfide bond formation protein DsbB [Lutimaribacter pacificus]
MTLTQKQLVLLAAGGSTALLAGAFLFQFLGWAPCELCLWQRWPHAAAIAIGAAALAIGGRGLAWAGVLAAAVAAGLALYHTGVERKWWNGPASCTGSGGLGASDGSALLPGAAADTPTLVLCDQVQPFFLGLTMANWNLVFSLGLVALWIVAATRRA